MINTSQQTLASIVTENHQTVPVLEKYNLDFCCKGKRTLAQACSEKGLSVEEVLTALESTSTTEKSNSMPFVAMSAEQLIGHILIHHHFYLKQMMPTIAEHLIKVDAKHFERFPYLTRVLELFLRLKNEMTMHMQKEEVVLFPRIKDVESFYHFKQYKKLESDYVNGPAGMMEKEHDEAGEIMSEIRELTNNYTPPQDACTTFRVSLAELKEFEEDLHKHVHLENNILFPLAEKMMLDIKNFTLN